ncbi:hypothetical protein F5887DRAFT_999698, partial [Amanita rubescens]
MSGIRVRLFCQTKYGKTLHERNLIRRRGPLPGGLCCLGPASDSDISAPAWGRHMISGENFLDALQSIIVYPQSTEDVINIVNIATKYKIPVVPYAGLELEAHTRGHATRILWTGL